MKRRTRLYQRSNEWYYFRRNGKVFEVEYKFQQNGEWRVSALAQEPYNECYIRVYEIVSPESATGRQLRHVFVWENGVLQPQTEYLKEYLALTDEARKSWPAMS